MANTIGSLIIDLVANTASFTTTLNKAVSDVEAGVAKIKTAFGGLAEVFTIAGIAELTKSTLEFGDQLEKSAIKTGTSAQAISELAFAARQVNIDLPELTSSFEKMEKVISTAGTGNRSAIDAFNALGISFEQIRQLSPDQQFEEIANQISKLADPTDKARAAMAIFGRAGAELLPLFEQGAAGIEQARQKAVDFGASLDADALKRLADASTAVKDLGQSFQALATTLAAKVAPTLKSVFDSLTSTVTGDQGAFLERRLTTLHALFDALASVQPEATGVVAGNFLQGQILQAESQIQGLKLAKQIKDSLASGGALTDNNPPGFNATTIDPIDTTAQKIQVSAMAKYYQELDDATKTGAEKLIDDTMAFQTKLEDLYDSKKISAGMFAVRESAAADAADLAGLLATNQAQIAIAYKESIDGVKESLSSQSEASKLAAENMKKDFETTANFAVQAGQSIQNSFASVFDNIGKGGLQGLVKDFVDAFRKIFDQAAAFDLAKALHLTEAFQNQGSGSAVGSIFAGFGSLFSGFGGGAGSTPSVPSSSWMGYANGGAFKVGGGGGTDSQLVQFKATPGEHVAITTPGQAAAGAIHFAPVYNVGSGVSRSDVISACAATQKATLAQMTKLIRGGAYG
jgi:hypothetical protein